MSALLIDAMNLVRRIYEARPHDGETIDNEVYRSAQQSLNRALNRHQPSHALAVFDSQDRTWRHDLFPQYKANRSPTPAVLISALPEFKAAFADTGVKSLVIPNYEADDVIATLAKGLAGKGKKVVILSTDKNFLQLLGENITIYDHFREQQYNRAWVQEKYGVLETQLTDYWSLTGDSTLNIKGVPKVGPKTAKKLFESYQGLEEIFQATADESAINRIKLHKIDA